MPDWENYERLTIAGKWRPCLRTAGRVDDCDPAREPFETLQKVVKLRNRLMHDKRPLEVVRRSGDRTVMSMEAEMAASFIERLPARLMEVMREFSFSVGMLPGWLMPVQGPMD
jgi:hypothetical protein